MSDQLKMVPFSSLAEINPVTRLPSRGECSFLSMADVSDDGRVTGSQDRDTRESAGYTAFRDGDVLFAKITPCMENGKGARLEGLTSGCGFGSTEFHVLRAKVGADSLFISHWAQSRTLRQKAEAFMIGSAGQRRVPGSFFDKFHVPLFSLAEQQKIAEVLDAVDEALLSAQESVAKLGSISQGLVSRLTARGAAGVGKQSEISGLGSVPSSWDVSMAGSEFIVSAGITLSPDRAPRGNASRYLRVANVQRGRIDLSDVAELQASPSECQFYVLHPGDLLIVEGHASPNEIGRCALVDSRQQGMLYQNHLFRLRGKSLIPKFAEIWFNSDIARRYWWRTCSTSSGLNTINSRQLKKLPVVVPPLEEQQRIVSIIESHDARIAAERAQLAKLRKLKAGLMDDLLTGRVRVDQLADLPV